MRVISAYIMPLDQGPGPQNRWYRVRQLLLAHLPFEPLSSYACTAFNICGKNSISS